MTIMSRGETPMEFSAAATFSTVGNSGNAISEALASFTDVLVLGVTVVRPRLLNAVGCDVFKVELTLTTMLPHATAQLEI